MTASSLYKQSQSDDQTFTIDLTYDSGSDTSTDKTTRTNCKEGGNGTFETKALDGTPADSLSSPEFLVISLWSNALIRDLITDLSTGLPDEAGLARLLTMSEPYDFGPRSESDSSDREGGEQE